MFRKLYLFLMLAWFLFACQGKARPEGILDKNTFKSVLKEVVLANMLNEQQVVKDSFDSKPLELIYKKYQLDSLSLQKNMDYYTQHPEILEEIYKEIKKEFKQKVDSLGKKNPQKNDTLNKKKLKNPKFSIPKDILNRK